MSQTEQIPISPEWIGFFQECRRLAALARTRRAAAQAEAEVNVSTSQERIQTENE